MGNMSLDQIVLMLQRMLGASVTTLELFLFTLLFSLPLGLVLAVGRMSRIKPLSWAIRMYLLVMRGTPLMLQLIFFWFCLPFSSRLVAAIVTFSLNYAAYFAEIYRSGIEGVPRGQWEAANVLGFSKTQTFFRVILPQVLKRVLPPMGNEFMTLVKDTSLAQVIAVVEITALANKLQSSYVSLLPIVTAGIFYLVMNTAISKGFSIAEKKLSYYQ